MSGRPKRLARAMRFPVHMAVRYREIGATSWFDGRTANVSESGLLFLPEHLLEPETAIEGRLVVPVAIAEELPAEVVFRGVVVRTAPSAGANAVPAMAVAMEEYRLVRGGQPVRPL